MGRKKVNILFKQFFKKNIDMFKQVCYNIITTCLNKLKNKKGAERWESMQKMQNSCCDW